MKNTLGMTPGEQVLPKLLTSARFWTLLMVFSESSPGLWVGVRVDK